MDDILNKMEINVSSEKLTFSKEIAIVLKKLKYGHLISGIKRNLDGSLSYLFEEIDNIRRYRRREFLNNYETTFEVEKFPDHCNITLKTSPIYFNIDKETKEQNFPFLEHFHNDEAISTTISSQKRGIVPNDSEEKGLDKFVRNIILFEENKDAIKSFLSIFLFSQNNNEIVCKFSFDKVPYVLKLFEPNGGIQHPKKESVSELIDIIKFYKKTKINKETSRHETSGFFGCGPIKAYRTREGFIKLTFSNMTLASEKSFEKFDYIFHPGIYAIARFLEKTENFNRFRIACQKMIYKNL